MKDLFKKVLLIEDDGAHALLVTRALAEQVGDIETSKTVSEAKEYLIRDSVNLIVTDLNLPDSSRAQHIHELKALAMDVPIIVLTASTSLHDAVEAMKHGARDFLVKNFDRDFKDMLVLSLQRLASTLSLERERQVLIREMNTLRTAIENSNDGLAVSSLEGKIAYSNSAFREFVNKCRGNEGQVAQLLGESVKGGDKLNAAIVEKLSSLPSGAVWHTEVILNTELISAYDLSLTSTTAVDNQIENVNCQSVIWIRDISEQKRREKLQREILSTTTHDLKGPLGAVLVSSDLVLDMVESIPKAKELVLRINSSAQGAINLIDELLSARRIQEGSLVLRPVNKSIAILVEEQIQNFETMAVARQIKLTCNQIDKDLVARVDAIGVGRVVSNLLSNALKFTPKGGQVVVSAFKEGDELHLKVSDSGTGIEPAEVQKLFSRFSRLQKHQDIAGTGLGLFVVKAIVTAHGGRVELTSKVNSGTTFDVILPLEPPVNERGELICLDF